MKNTEIKKGPRYAAAQAVLTFLKHDAYPDRLIHADAHRAVVMTIVYGVVRQLRALRFIEKQLVNRTPQPVVESILLCGLYQLMFMSHTESFAVVDESVEITKQLSNAGTAGFVNAVLRRALREKVELQRNLEAQPAPVRLSHPDNLFNRWERRYGVAVTHELCEWNNQPADVIVRVDPNKVSPAEYSNRLKSNDIPAHPHPVNGAFFIIPHGVRVRELPGYGEGVFTVQDPATAAAVDLLVPKPGESILDACAAPGGKTLMIAERMKYQGYLLAADVKADRLRVLHENIKRAGAEWVDRIQADLTSKHRLDRLLPCHDFDGILIDAPCTNTGVIRRRPDARWRFSSQTLESVKRTQKALLDVICLYVRPGGRLVYSTCSLEPEENEEMVSGWLSTHPEFTLDTAVQFVPPRNKTDGAYAALLKKRPM